MPPTLNMNTDGSECVLSDWLVERGLIPPDISYHYHFLSMTDDFDPVYGSKLHQWCVWDILQNERVPDLFNTNTVRDWLVDPMIVGAATPMLLQSYPFYAPMRAVVHPDQINYCRILQHTPIGYVSGYRIKLLRLIGERHLPEFQFV